MAVSVFELFSIGIGPSSSHTVGPMRAARMFLEWVEQGPGIEQVSSVSVELLGSLGATGRGHGSDRAVILGLRGFEPETVDPGAVEEIVQEVHTSGSLSLLGRRTIDFDPDSAVILDPSRTLPQHPNGMIMRAFDDAGVPVAERTYFSIGGGFVVDESHYGSERDEGSAALVPYPFATGADLLARCEETGLPVSGVMLANELTWRSEAEVRSALLAIWHTMRECVEAGCVHEGLLPGGLSVRRRAPELRQRLLAGSGDTDPLQILDWVSLYAMAVNEENAAGGRVVTAPTNGAAGVIPAVLHYHRDWVPGADDDDVIRFLLTAGAIAVIVTGMASISGAEVGCQGEVGSACAMAAAGLAEVMGGTPRQVENAAEIAMEHNLGLTCDPIGGLVQIPCIERNAVAAVKAIAAARTALAGDGTHMVSLDQVIRTMRQTGADMNEIYKETSRGGLAVNVVEC